MRDRDREPERELELAQAQTAALADASLRRPLPSRVELLGIGLGPANLALAAATADLGDSAPSALFIDRRPHVRWHEGAVSHSSQLQVPFLKDIATLRDPRSAFTFLAYLKAERRLAEFVNLREWYPSRAEFADYLRWVAGGLGDTVRFRCHATAVRLASGGGFVVELHRDGQALAITATCVAVACGQRPHMPSFVRAHARVTHSSSLMPWLGREFPDSQQPLRFLVVGGGQSAVESAMHLYDSYPASQVELAYPRYALRRIDDNPFVNEHFTAEGAAAFHHLPTSARRDALDDLHDTNTGVVDERLIDKLWRAIYDSSLRAPARIRTSRWAKLEGIVPVGPALRCHLRRRPENTIEERIVDGVVLATGYRNDAHTELLAPLQGVIVSDGSGEPPTDAAHRVRLRRDAGGDLFLHGLLPTQHGPAEPNLSCCATRAETILQAVVERVGTRTLSRGPRRLRGASLPAGAASWPRGVPALEGGPSA